MMKKLMLINPTPTAPPGVSDMVEKVIGWLMWAGWAAVIVGFIVAGIMLVIANDRGMGNENVKKVGLVIMGAIIIASALTLANALL
ncbi:hypothetical protein V5R04_00270 [Jonesiaceae bacterium BS-20]|uniref:Uncharacterized protein n=1 Tax=Jonesiaceae bacterium BS-20 TaxID=3120821 RepID=A0AAU7DVH0_9MICO